METEGKVSKETKAFRHVFASLDSPLIVDLSDTDPTDGPSEIELPDADLALPAHPCETHLRAYGWLLNRKTASLQGGWVLYRSNDLPSGSGTATRNLTEWLGEMGMSELSSLSKSDASLSDIDDRGQCGVYRVIKDFPGLAERAASGRDVRVRLHYTFSVEGVNAKTGKPERFALANEATGPVDYKADTDAQQAAPIAAVHDGTLDFGAGEVLTVRDLTQRACKEFGVRSRVDGRILRSSVFAKGRFTLRRFKAALAKLAEVEAPQILDESAEAYAARLQAIREKLWRILADEDDSQSGSSALKKSLLSGDKSMTAQDFLSKYPGLGADLASHGIDPNSTVKVTRDLVLRVSSEGIGAGGGGQIFNDIRFGLIGH